MAPNSDAIARALWEASDLALVVIDRALDVRRMNACAARILRCSESGPSNLARLVSPEDATRLSRVIATDPVPEGPHLLRVSTQSGDAVATAALHLTAVPMPDPSSGNDLVLLVGREVSRDIVREARVRRAGRLEIVGEVAQAVGHDLNNALGTITTLADLLLGDAEAGSEIAMDMADIKAAAWDAAAISRTLQLFAAGRARPRDSPDGTDVRQAFEELEPLLRRVMPKNVVLVIEAVAECPPVQVTPNAIAEMVMALAINSRDAMPQGGTLRITARPRYSREHGGAAVMVEVEDDGTTGWDPGADESFEPFFSTKDLMRGTGLGLSTVRALVDGAGGSIGAEARSGGSVVRIVLPAFESDREDG